MFILTLLVIALMISQMCFWYVLKGLMQENNELRFKEDMSATAIKLINIKVDSLTDIVFEQRTSSCADDITECIKDDTTEHIKKAIKAYKKTKKAKKA